jgi:hypothetical protein
MNCGCKTSDQEDIVDERFEESPKADTPKPKKKPYVKPAFRYEKVFETHALSCGKIAPTQSTCQLPASRKTS